MAIQGTVSKCCGSESLFGHHNERQERCDSSQCPFMSDVLRYLKELLSCIVLKIHFLSYLEFSIFYSIKLYI